MNTYHEMILEVFRDGTRKENRTGVDTLSTFNFNYELAWDLRMGGRFGPREYVGDSVDGAHRVPLLTTKNVSWKNIVVEMLWFLSGDPTIKILQQHGCKFWDPWADAEGNVPMAYGEQWRRFPSPAGVNDQIAWVLDQLRNNPMSRRLVVSAWAPELAQTAKLPPCHMIFAFNVQNVEEPLEETIKRAKIDLQKKPSNLQEELRQELINKYIGDSAGRDRLRTALISAGYTPKVEQRLCLHLTQRSCDLALGVPYNMASYGLLLLIFSHLTGIKPGIFAHTLLDLHIYTSKPDGSMGEYDHVPGLREQLTRKPRELPILKIDPSIKELSDIEALMKPGVSTEEILEKFKLEGYDPHPAIKFKVAV